MNFFEDCLLLLGLPAGMILAGYWPASYLSRASAGERLAVASLAGVAALLWSVTVVNFFHPLAGVWAWACLWPVLPTLLGSRARNGLATDLGFMAASPRGRITAALCGGFLLALLWPLLTRGTLVFYDGTSNHDSFFWVSAAEYLKRHSYMDAPVRSALHPLYNDVAALIGWKPIWGRMGSEGLLALVSALIGVSAIKIYLCATAALFIPWIAAVYLATRTFLFDRLSLPALAALVVLEPIFVFFHGNANLPNLVGLLMGVAVVVATERALREETGRVAWLALLAFAFHGLLCVYPEMVPFILLPGALLWGRGWFMRRPRRWWPLVWVALAYFVGLALNPASSGRAIHGFVSSFDTARANQNWANLFSPLSAAQYVPALATLAEQAAYNLGPLLGAIVSLVLVVTAGLAIRRSRDPYGAMVMLAGSAALVAYTLGTGFDYGWQKAVQFGGVFLAALMPVALVELLLRLKPAGRWPRWAARGALGVVLTFFTYATVRNLSDGYEWSRHKLITHDWFRVRAYARVHLDNAPVLIDGASFPMAFFDSMWATYFLPDSQIYFAARGEQNGGYLRDSVINEANHKLPPIRGYLVSRAWADSFDADSQRLVLGDTVALLSESNRVTGWQGLYPMNGRPEDAGRHIVVTLRPHDASRFSLVLAPRSAASSRSTRWQVACATGPRQTFTATISGPPPWRFSVPLTAGQINRIELTASPASAKSGNLPFVVRQLRVEALP